MGLGRALSLNNLDLQLGLKLGCVFPNWILMRTQTISERGQHLATSKWAELVMDKRVDDNCNHRRGHGQTLNGSGPVYLPQQLLPPPSPARLWAPPRPDDKTSTALHGQQGGSFPLQRRLPCDQSGWAVRRQTSEKGGKASVFSPWWRGSLDGSVPAMYDGDYALPTVIVKTGMAGSNSLAKQQRDGVYDRTPGRK